MRPPVEVGELIAERTLQLHGLEGGTREVVIRVGKPRRGPTEHDDWYCPYELTGIPGTTVSAAYGVDSYQALQLCLEKIRAEIAHYRRGRLELTWLDDPDLGL